MATIKGIKVGTSTITANYGSLSSSVNLTVTALNVSAATISGLSNKVYTGSAFKLEPTVKMTVGGVETTLVKGTDYTLSWNSTADNSTCIAVGTITVTVTGKGNYTGTNTTGTYQITNATITVSAPDQTYEYTGSAQGVAITATTVNSQTATIKYGTTSGTYNLTSAPQITNVSESKTIYYQVTAPNHTTKTGSYQLTITEKAISIPAPTSNTKTYTGTTYYATFPAATGATITKYQTSSDGSTWTDANPATTNPGRSTQGTTYVRAYYTANTNYTGSGYSNAATITINPATITVVTTGESSVINQTYEYTGSAQGKGLTATTVNSQTATIKYGTTSGTYNLTSAPQATNVADSKTVYYQVTAPNHTTVTGSYSLTITNKAISIPTPTNGGGTYTGSAYSATFNSATGASITKYRYSTTDGSNWTETTTNPSQTNVGTLYVQAYYTANTNYTGSTWSSSATITVTNATITAKTSGQSSVINQSYVYNGSAQGVGLIATTVNSQTATITYRVGTSGSYSSTVPTRTNVADTPITVYYKITAPNHAENTGSYTLTITKATPTMALLGNIVTPETDTTSPSGIEYHGTAYIEGRASVPGIIYWGTTSESTGMTNQATVTTGSTSSYNTSITTRTALGTTTVWAYFVPTDSSNYNSLGSASAAHTNAAAKIIESPDNDITVTKPTTLAYTGSAQVIATKTAGEGCAHFTLGYSTTSGGTVTWGTEDATTLSVTGPGTYYIHYKVTPDTNHSTTISNKELTGAVTIGEGTLIISGDNVVNINEQGYSGTYDGSAHNIVTAAPTVKNQADQTVTGVTFTYSETQNGTYTSTLTRTNATGTSSNEDATVTYYGKAEKAGYTTQAFTVIVKIARANNPLSITAPTGTTSSNRYKIYDTTANNLNKVQITTSGAQGTVSYSSSASGKASVNSSGLVTYVSAGTANITVTAAGNSNYKSGTQTVYVESVVDTVATYGDITGNITITQIAYFPASGVTLSTSNISTYFSYESTCAQTITWASGNTTSGTVSHAWSGTTVSIPSLGTTETADVTARTISFTVTATGEGSKTKTKSVTSGNQEANPVTAISLALKNGSTTTTTVAYGSTVTTEVTATYKSGASGTITPTSVTSSDTTVAQVL